MGDRKMNHVEEKNNLLIYKNKEGNTFSKHLKNIFESEELL